MDEKTAGAPTLHSRDGAGSDICLRRDVSQVPANRVVVEFFDLTKTGLQSGDFQNCLREILTLSEQQKQAETQQPFSVIKEKNFDLHSENFFRINKSSKTADLIGSMKREKEKINQLALDLLSDCIEDENRAFSSENEIEDFDDDLWKFTERQAVDVKLGQFERMEFDPVVRLKTLKSLSIKRPAKLHQKPAKKSVSHEISWKESLDYENRAEICVDPTVPVYCEKCALIGLPAHMKQCHACEDFFHKSCDVATPNDDEFDAELSKKFARIENAQDEPKSNRWLCENCAKKSLKRKNAACATVKSTAKFKKPPENLPLPEVSSCVKKPPSAQRRHLKPCVACHAKDVNFSSSIYCSDLCIDKVVKQVYSLMGVDARINDDECSVALIDKLDPSRATTNKVAPLLKNLAKHLRVNRRFYPADLIRPSASDVLKPAEHLLKNDWSMLTPKQPATPPVVGIPSSALQGAKVDQVRMSVRQLLRDCLINRMNDCDDILLSKDEVKNLAIEIELEMFQLYNGVVGTAYKKQFKALLVNLKDLRNDCFFRRILDGTLAPSQLASIGGQEMARKESVTPLAHGEPPCPDFRRPQSSASLGDVPVPLDFDDEHAPIAAPSFDNLPSSHNLHSTATSDVSTTSTVVSDTPIVEPPIFGASDGFSTRKSTLSDKKHKFASKRRSEGDRVIRDTTFQHKSHLFDLNCKICTGQVPASYLATSVQPSASKIREVLPRPSTKPPESTTNESKLVAEKRENSLEPSKSVTQPPRSVVEPSRTATVPPKTVFEPCETAKEPPNPVQQFSMSTTAELSKKLREPPRTAEPLGTALEPSMVVTKQSAAVAQPSFSVPEPSIFASQPREIVMPARPSVHNDFKSDHTYNPNGPNKLPGLLPRIRGTPFVRFGPPVTPLERFSGPSATRFSNHTGRFADSIPPLILPVPPATVEQRTTNPPRRFLQDFADLSPESAAGRQRSTDHFDRSPVGKRPMIMRLGSTGGEFRAMPPNPMLGRPILLSPPTLNFPYNSITSAHRLPPHPAGDSTLAPPAAFRQITMVRSAEPLNAWRPFPPALPFAAYGSAGSVAVRGAGSHGSRPANDAGFFPNGNFYGSGFVTTAVDGSGPMPAVDGSGSTGGQRVNEAVVRRDPRLSIEFDDISAKPATSIGSPPKACDFQSIPNTWKISSCPSAGPSSQCKPLQNGAEPSPPVVEEYVWRGFLDMPGYYRFNAAFVGVSGPAELLSRDLPNHLKLVGRIPRETVLEYVRDLRGNLTKDVVVIRVAEPPDLEQKAQYHGLFTNMVQRGRAGVVDTNKLPKVKDLYLMPLSDNEEPHPHLLPFDGPGEQRGRGAHQLGEGRGRRVLRQTRGFEKEILTEFRVLQDL